MLKHEANGEFHPGKVFVSIFFSEPVNRPEVRLGSGKIAVLADRENTSWSGSFEIPENGPKSETLTLTIDALDRNPHYGGEGGKLDRDPATPARRVVWRDGVRWNDYQAGQDIQHSLKVTRGSEEPLGEVVFADDFETEEPNYTVYNWGTDTKGRTDFKDGGEFRLWNVTSGAVDLVVHGNKFVDLDGTWGWGKPNASRENAKAGRMETKKPILLPPGKYTLAFRLSGNPYQTSRDKNAVTATLGAFVQETLAMPHGSSWKKFQFEFTVESSATENLAFDHSGVKGDWDGLYLDDVRVVRRTHE